MVELNRKFLVNKFGSENQLQELTQIEFSYYYILEWINSNAFKGLVNLEKISLTSNGLEEIEGDLFEDLPNLKYLDLSYNKLKKIDSNAFEGLKQLEELHLNKNELTVINDNLTLN
jgi:Leucine-rich repeat (LRR) protein